MPEKRVKRACAVDNVPAASKTDQTDLCQTESYDL